jgi:glycosyltransferase involved in cell wall biosynthesis
MVIHLHILCWNEAYLLPSTLDYYSRYVDSITVHDNFSSDGSQEIARSFGAKVENFGKRNSLDDRAYLQIKNADRAKSGADWVIVCDADELLFHPLGLRHAIMNEEDKGSTFLRVKGFNIYSDAGLSDVEELLDIDTGFPYPNFDKNICFKPKHVKPNYNYGAHSWNPKGKLIASTSQFYLFHYRCIGGVQRMIDRHAQYKARMSQFNKDNRLSFHYLRSEQEIKKEWEENIRKIKPFQPF